MSAETKKVLIYYIHPASQKSHVNRALIKAVEGLEGITTRYLYDEYPDFFIDVKKEQILLEQHNIIVWQHPFYWYSAPSMLKEWIDLVLEYGWAYGRGGDALAGKKLLTAITTGGGKEAYQHGGRNNYTVNELLYPFKQTCNLCKVQYLPPFITHSSLVMKQDEIRAAGTNYKKIILSLRDDIFSEEELSEIEYINDLLT